MARAVSVSIINQFKLHDSFCLRLASVHLTHPFHLVLGFQLFGHAVSFRQIRHDQLHAVSCFDNLGTILSYAHPLIPAGSFYLLNLAMPSRLCRLFLCSRSIVAAAFSFVCPVSMYSSRSAYLRPISASSVCPSNRPAEGAFSIIHAGASR